MSRTRIYQFGAGSLESLRLKVWTRKRLGDMRQIRVKLEGTYMVYCGYGNEHTHVVNVLDGAWDGERDQYAVDVINARDGHDDAAERIVQSLLEVSLEDWEDPCYEIDVYDEPTTGKFWVEYA